MKVDPAPFSKALDQAGFTEKFQMAAEARLALAEDERQILDVQFAGLEQQ